MNNINTEPTTPTPTSLRRVKSSDKTKTLLPEDFQPGEFHVICGNKRSCFNSSGNKRFRLICKQHVEEFCSAPSKHEKSYVVTKVLRALQENCGSEPVFVAFEKGRWWKVSDRTSREKVGTYFRDSLADTYKSSSKNKIAQRRKKRNQASPSAESMQQSAPAVASQQEMPVPIAPTASAPGIPLVVPFARKVSSNAGCASSAPKTMVTNAILSAPPAMIDFHQFPQHDDPMNPTPLRFNFPPASNQTPFMKPFSFHAASPKVLPSFTFPHTFPQEKTNGDDDYSIGSSSTTVSFYDIVDLKQTTLEE